MTERDVRQPEVLVFDVNGTLSDLSPLAETLAEVGAPRQLLQTWFAATLRDGIGLTAAHGFETFEVVARGTLTLLLAQTAGFDGDPADAAARVVAGLADLPVHADVVPGLRAAHAAGLRLVTLTNGGVATTERLLAGAGLDDVVEHRLSVDAVGRWKPALEPYLHAAETCGADPAAMTLVAVHPWDIDGATRAGLSSCWVDRERAAAYPAHLAAPGVTVTSMTDLVAAVGAG